MDIADNTGAFATNEVGNFSVGVGLAPGLLQPHNVCALALRHFGEAIGEVSIGEHRELRSRLYEVRDSRFHAGAAGARDHQDGGVFSAEDALEQLLDILHDLDEKRIEVSHDGLRECLIDAGMHHGRPRPEKVSRGRLKGREQIVCRS